MRSHLVLVSALALISALISDVVQAVPSTISTCVNTDSVDALRGPRQHHLRSSRRDRGDRGDRDESLLEILRRDRRFSRLVEVVSRAGGNLKDDLEENGREQTLLAPTNDAFEAFEQNHGRRVEDLGHHDLSRLIRYHIIPNRAFNKDDLEEGDLLETAIQNHKPLGDERSQVIRVSRHGERVVLNMYSQIIEADLDARNGVIHALSEVLHVPRPMGESISAYPERFSTHALALHLTGLIDRVDRTPRITALVASNEAWESMGHDELRELFDPDNRDELKRALLKHYIPDVAYIRELAQEHGLSEEECSRGRLEQNDRDDDENRNRVAKRKFNTWADEDVTIRVVCRGRQLRAMVDETSISIADFPADNGVAHVINSPLVLNKRRGRRDRDHRRPNNPNPNHDNGDDEESDDSDINNDNESDEERRRHRRERRERRDPERRDRERRDRERRDRERRRRND